MKYREFLNSLSDADFSEIIATDGIMNVACVENLEHKDNLCPHEYKKCAECILKLLQSDIEDT